MSTGGSARAEPVQPCALHRIGLILERRRSRSFPSAFRLTRGEDVAQSTAWLLARTQLAFGPAACRPRRSIRAIGAGDRAGPRPRVFTQYSLQGDHAHLIVEARDARALASGMKSIGARLARRVNRIRRRSGTVLDGRYHHRLLRTPREVRNALAYVLLNARKHWRQRHGAPPPTRLDAASSGAWFDGWARVLARAPDPGPAAVASPRTWLLRIGWRRHGLIDLAEVPASPS